MCAEGPWFAPGYGRGDGLKLYCYTCFQYQYLCPPHSSSSSHSISSELSPTLIAFQHSCCFSNSPFPLFQGCQTQSIEGRLSSVPSPPFQLKLIQSDERSSFLIGDLNSLIKYKGGAKTRRPLVLHGMSLIRAPIHLH